MVEAGSRWFCFTPNSPVIIAGSQILAQDASPLTISCHMLIISQRTQRLLISQRTQGTTWIMHISCRHHFCQIGHEAAPWGDLASEYLDKREVHTYDTKSTLTENDNIIGRAFLFCDEQIIARIPWRQFLM